MSPKTFLQQVMMTGELDYESAFLENDSPLAPLSIVILVVFIVLVFIILSNLLVGLAVSDMYAIRQRWVRSFIT